MKAPLPDNETARLKALNDCKILDTEPESAFDDITRLAASICETPIAIVSLVDVNRQWFKSKVGLEMTQLSRDISFCAHAILQPDVFIVADTLADQRFATNPLVTSDPNIRFYAGVPLITSENQALGTLNVIDRVPRKLNPQQIQALWSLSRQIVNQMELRRKVAKLEHTPIKRQQTKKELRQFLKIAIGLGLALAILVTVALSYRSLTSLLQPANWHQDYKVIELKDIREARLREIEAAENRLLIKQSKAAKIDARNTIFAFASGIILSFLILFVYYLIDHKIAKRQLIESPQRDFTFAILDTIAFLVVVLDSQGKIVRFNRACEQTTGYGFDEVRSKYFWELFLPEEVEVVKAAFLKLRVGHPNQHQNYWSTRDGDRRLIAWSNTALRGEASVAEYIISSGMDITELKRVESELRKSEEQYRDLLENTSDQQANEQRFSCWVDELEQRNHEITLLNKLSDVLQACFTIEEAYTVIPQLLQPLFPESVGGLFLINTSKNLVEAVAIWGSTPLNSEQLFAPHDCWALRRGRAHLVVHPDNGLLCNHLHHALPADSLCVPMMAQGEALGMLYLSSIELGQFTAAKQQLAKTVAENIALALANLKLRQTLHNQSIRDPLTGLFNRRYMEESLEREIQRCDRKQQPLSIIMIDLDYFKRFNDTFGHEAGDAVLREVAQFLQKFVRGSDIACRYGGEEFILILPEASLEVTYKRAEQLREGIKHLKLEPRYYAFGSLTLSIGIASFPEHGTCIEFVIRAADAALYRAKNEGRDAIRLAS